MRTYIPKNYSMSKNRYAELRHMCLQYTELQQQKYTSRSDQAQRKLWRIESAVMQAVDNNPLLYACLLENVTRGRAYEHLDCPCGRRQFYEARSAFFYLLDRFEETERSE